MPISPIGAAAPALSPRVTGDGAARATGSGFGDLLNKGLQNVQGLQGDADAKAAQLATGELKDVHDYTIAATRATLATELTVAVRNKAVEAFNDIMRMQL